MKYIDEHGHFLVQDTFQDRFLKKLYDSRTGRMVLKLLTRPWVSKVGGALLSTSFSSCLIPGFIKRNHISMEQYESCHYRSFNDFFTRKIRSGMRPLPDDPTKLLSPCDGKVSVYPIHKNGCFFVKDTLYTAASLIRNRKAAARFDGGFAVVIRLSVDDYHRYCYIDDGVKSDNHFIQGIYHTVNPVAGDYVPVYKENSREVTLMKTEHFGEVIQTEVGALMVGKITNHDQAGEIRRGDEKGYFEFGGSTIVLFFRRDKVQIHEDLIERTKRDCETKVKMGQVIGKGVSC